MKPNFKKMLTTIGLLAVAVPTTLSVVACGPSSESTTPLSDIIKEKKVAGSIDDTEGTIIDKVIAANSDKIKKNEIKIKSKTFKPADYENEGEAIIISNTSKYTGEATIIISAVSKTQLSEAIANKEVQGTQSDNENNILNKVLEQNKNLTANDIQVQKGSFEAANYDQTGSVIIEAKAPKFTGTVNITIKAWEKTQLSDVIKEKTIKGSPNETESTVLDKIVAANKDIKNEQIAIKKDSFKPADYNNSGSAIIIAKADKFTGEVAITINAIEKTQLSEAIANKEVQGTQSDNENNILNKVLEQNKNLTANDIQVQKGSFEAANYDQTGSVIIEAKAPKFTGTVNITIKAWEKTQLSDVIKEKTIKGSPNETESTVLDKIVAANKDIKNEQIAIKKDSFKPADYNNSGSAIIIAKADKFTGEVAITINAIEKTQLSEAIANKEVPTNTTNQTLIKRVLSNNSGTNVTAKDLVIESFDAPTKTNDGSAVISANSESNFSGTVTISIPTFRGLASNLLNRIITIRIIDSNIANNKENLLSTLVDQYEKLNTQNIFIKDFIPATATSYGKATVSTNKDSNVGGEVDLVINKLDSTYSKLINNLRNTDIKTPAKKSAWYAYFTYRLKQFTEVYSQGLLIADLDGTEDNNAWRFLYWVILQQRVELKHQNIIIDYQEEFDLDNQKYKWEKENNIVYYSADFTIKFWNNEKSTFNIKDFKMFYEVNNIKL